MSIAPRNQKDIKCVELMDEIMHPGAARAGRMKGI
jgi:hypothetical protein